MVQSIIDLNEHQDRVINIVKGKYGLKNKSDAVKFIIEKFETDMLEQELRPEYVEKIKSIEKRNKFVDYRNLSELRRDIEHA
ncbi:DUF2683 family protein [Candidatus Woesearchaeota archaeon]|nr:DUF2683 family protein [Candidatus Woesearchaeota archaeon]